MTILDVDVNGQRLCRAGVGPDGVLNAIVSWVKLAGPALAQARTLGRPNDEARLHVGGLRDDAHRAWADRPLQVGDRITIVLGTATRADRPARLERRDVRRDEERERRYYERLKQKYEPPPSTDRARDGATRFLNVDLDIDSRAPLDAVVAAFGRHVLVLHVGKDGRRHVAHLELAAQPANPDRAIQRFVRLIDGLPAAARRAWRAASAREFSIGIQAAATPHAFELRLQPATLRAAARVRARIGVTVYAGMGSGLYS